LNGHFVIDTTALGTSVELGSWTLVDVVPPDSDASLLAFGFCFAGIPDHQRLIVEIRNVFLHAFEFLRTPLGLPEPGG